MLRIRTPVIVSPQASTGTIFGNLVTSETVSDTAAHLNPKVKNGSLDEETCVWVKMNP